MLKQSNWWKRDIHSTAMFDQINMATYALHTRSHTEEHYQFTIHSNRHILLHITVCHPGRQLTVI